MSKEQALEELLKMIKEGNITDYDAELASYRDEKYGYKDIDENTQRLIIKNNQYIMDSCYTSHPLKIPNPML
ncbi:hypothetical protein DW067_00465 [Lachnospira eligens]|uniref:hypothetical protein n=1 Tax=Lachnospira eligens TaxID=39485 RepID=UPI000E5D281D|nr:hypothetical protein [Lachnospira eligens]RHK47418.1 hypothetical protein DW067_00465 [Lachnospira eligens]